MKKKRRQILIGVRELGNGQWYVSIAEVTSARRERERAARV